MHHLLIGQSKDPISEPVQDKVPSTVGPGMPLRRMKLFGIAFDDEAVSHQEVDIANAGHIELRSDADSTELKPQAHDALGAGLAPRVHEPQLLARTQRERGSQCGECGSRDEAQLQNGVGDDDEVAFGEAHERAFESKVDVVNRVLLERASLVD